MKQQFNNSDGLTREVGPFSATALVIANMIGTGIFTTSGFIMAELGSPTALLLCWLMGGVFALCGALCYAELGARHPKAGGEYVYLKHAYGKGMGFLSGWISKRSLGQARSFGGFSTYPLDVIRANTFLGLFTIPAGHDAWPHEASRMRVRANVIFVRTS